MLSLTIVQRRFDKTSNNIQCIKPSGRGLWRSTARAQELVAITTSCVRIKLPSDLELTEYSGQWREMYKLDIQVDTREAAAIERRRTLEQERQKRIFNARERTIGVSVLPSLIPQLLP